MRRLSAILFGLGVVVALVLSGPAAIAAPIHLADSSPFHVSDSQRVLQIDGFIVVALSIASVLVSIPIVRHRKRKQAARQSAQHQDQPVGSRQA